MVSDVEKQGVDIHSGRRDDRFQAGQGFFVEASSVLFRPLLEGGVNRLRNTL